jgi:hypothetical protein
VAAALSVIAVVVVVSLVFGRSGSGGPPALRLASGGGSDTAAAADAPLAAGKRGASGSSFQLVGTLPSGPDESRAQLLPRGAAKEVDVRRLAAAAGIDDAPRRVDGAWQAGTLRVEDAAGNPWSMYAGCGPDQPVSSDGGAVSVCSSGTVDVGAGSSGSSGSGTGPDSGTAPTSTTVAPAPAAPPVMSPCPDNARCAKPGWAAAPPSPGPTADVEAARRTAKAVLDKLGLSEADMSVQGAGEQVFVQADPRVDGLRTSGYTTQLQIDAAMTLVGGNGYLGHPTAAASYPLISAAKAFDNLPEQPRPLYACMVETDCPQPVPAKVTGAELGLQLTALADDEAGLLPAWLFTVEGWPMPLAQPAIEPRFLELPTPEPVDPGVVDPGPADPVPPVAPPAAGARSTFSFDAVFPTDEPHVVIVQYGDSGSCPHTNVTPVVKEDADSVVVTLEADTQPEQACTADYRQQLVTLKLTAPLGDRKVIDGSRGEPVAVDRTCARPMGSPAAPKSCKG